MPFKDFRNLVDELRATTKRTEKEALLKRYENNVVCKNILHFLFNPYIITGISDKKYKKHRQIMNSNVIADIPFNILEAIEYFKTNNTGRDKDILKLCEYIKSCQKLYNEEDNFSGNTGLFIAVIQKNLKLGVEAKTLNKVYGEDFVPNFSVMLAEKFADFSGSVEGQEFIITEKLDGVRCVLTFENQTPVFRSRQGQPIEQLVEIEEQAKKLNKNYVYDGELLLENKNNLKSEDLYRATVTITSSDNVKTGIIFNVFDRISKDDFIKGFSEKASLDRKTELEEELFELKLTNIIPVKMLYVGENTKIIFERLEEYVAMDKEGIMVNIAKAPYEAKRTKNLLKVKKFQTADVFVESLEEGTNAIKGKLGAVYVRFIGPDNKEYKCKVGSGFKLEEREFFWQNKNEILNKIIEISYFEITKNQKNSDYSLRFPVFKHLRNDKTEISMH